MKVLFTSVGRRVELLQAFKNAAFRLKLKLIIIGADNSTTAPALYFCDERLQICKVIDKNYIPNLLDYCKNNKVDLLIPTIDTDLLILSEHKADFEKIGTKVLIAKPEKIKLCRDKNLTSDYFISLGLNAPKPIYGENYDFPVFIKPKDGSSSINAFKVNNKDELIIYKSLIKDYVIQPYIKGTEYTVDICCNYEGEPIYITPRIRLATRSGEVMKTEIRQDDKIISDMKKLLADFKPSGPITVQFIREEKTNKDYYIEINPRFGGGAPLSIKAGADSAEAIIKFISGEKIGYIDRAATDHKIYSRFDQSICIN